MMSDRNNLPPEIIEAILPRLPAKSLGRFKSVSKSWCSLISDPQFIKTHLDLNNHHKTSKLILISYTQSLYSLDINEILTYMMSEDMFGAGIELSFRPLTIRWAQILGSCNGLVLALDEDDTLYLMNPTTRELSEIPLCPFLPFGEKSYLYGFGYDSSSDDYKVILICFWDSNYFEHEYNPDCLDTFVSVYSLSDNSWRTLRNCSYDLADCNPMGGVLINGSLHWLITTRPNQSLTIIAIRLANEELTEIELPDYNKALSRELVVVGGKLGFCHKYSGKDLWVMEEYGVGASWMKVSIDGDGIDVDDNNWNVVLPDNEYGAVIHDVDDILWRNVKMEVGYGYDSLMYIESLVSPKCTISTI